MRNFLFKALLFFYLAAVYSTVNADQTGIDITPDGATIDGHVYADPQYATLHYSSDTGAYQNLSTTNWYKHTTWDTKAAFGNLSSSTSSGIITVLNTAGAGTYKVTLLSSIKAPAGAVISQGIAKNDVVVDTFSREMTVGPERSLTTFQFYTAHAGETIEIVTPTDSTTYAFSLSSTVAQNLDALLDTEGKYLHVNENNGGADGFDLYGEVSSVDIPEEIICRNCGYDGSGHTVKYYAYDDLNTTWNAMTGLGTDFYDTGALPGAAGDYTTRIVKVPTPRKNYVNSSGVFKFRIWHAFTGSQTHDWEADSLSLRDRDNSIPFPSQHEVSLVAGDTISVYFKSDTVDSDIIKNHVDIIIQRIGN